jgi:hypothetical protein
VLDEIKEEDMRSALALCLPHVVKRVIHGQRQQNGGKSLTIRQAKKIKDSGVRDFTPEWTEFLLKVERMLHERVYIDEEAGWKFLGDCTREELLLIAAAYDQRSADNQAQARFYRQLEIEVGAAGVTTPTELIERRERGEEAA